MDKKKKKGYTLLEVVVSLAILGVGIVPVLTLVSGTLKYEREAASYEELARLSGTVIDYIKSQGYDNYYSDLSSVTPEREFLNYTINLNTDGDAFILASTEISDFYGVPFEFTVLNSNGLNLREISLKVDMKLVNIGIRDFNKNSEQNYTPPELGELNSEFLLDDGTMYTNSTELGDSRFIYGRVTTNYSSVFLGKSITSSSIFIISPLERWD